MRDATTATASTPTTAAMRDATTATATASTPTRGVTPSPSPAPLPSISASSIAVNDQPLLAVPTATPPPVIAGLLSKERPVRLVIASLGLDEAIVAAGLDAQRYPIVPPHNVAWYNLSAHPGQGDNIVLWGHVLRFRNAPSIPAPFARIHELHPGAEIELYTENGQRATYRVTYQIQVTPDQIEYMLPKGRERLTMISCIGDLVLDQGEVDMSHRLITIAEPAP
ncbi:hypothetical protein A9Q02_22150 [Candidatus Chloroploca asiatica]|uniref:Sortase n=2 Tax=Candidatus Chloroploca asiatica TaxID=1506545 RepID=A0A2H3KVL4_9CHLR|nr:hypothetical protein A9Q02_22150 [Candidatus Chloroploca asiatica]